MLSNHLSPNLNPNRSPNLNLLKKHRRNVGLRVGDRLIEEQPLRKDRLDDGDPQEENRCRQNNLKNRHLMPHLPE